MFPRSNPTACRLTARRRLALGGLVMTGALAAGMLASAPAFADPTPVDTVTTMTGLEAAVQDTSVQQIQLLNFTNDAQGTVLLHVAGSKSLDIDGVALNADQVVVDPGDVFTVTNTLNTPGDYRSGGLYIDASAQSAGATTATAVLLGADAEFHVSNAHVTAQGGLQGAGIGSADPTARFVADDAATVEAFGGDEDDDDTAPGGAAIGGAMSGDGIHVTVADDAVVTAHGGPDAAGVGGGSGGAGGAVRVEASGTLDASQGIALQSASPASAIGAGQGGGASGSLAIDSGAELEVDSTSPLHLSAGTTVVNRGHLYLVQPDGDRHDVVDGAGRIDNLGTITAKSEDADGNGPTTDPTGLLGSDVKVIDNNFDVTLDPNGGSISGAPTSGHLYSDSLYDLVGDDYWVQPGSDADGFVGFNTAADGSGTDVSSVDGDHGLGSDGSSTGDPVLVRLFAKFVQLPYATASSLPDAVVGTPYRAALPVAGPGISDYEVAGPQSSSDTSLLLPAGLSIDSSTGVISGTPTEASERDVNFFVKGTGGYGTVGFHIAVGGAPVFGTTSLPGGAAGTEYSSTIAVSGGPATYSVVSGSLPVGLKLNASTGAITGTPSGSASASFTIRATNRFGSSDRAFTLAIASVAAPPISEPVLTSVPRTSVQFGHEVTRAVSANSALPVTFKVTDGSLPKGVSLNAKTGLISGTAEQSGTFRAEVTATSSAGSATTEVVIAVSPLEHLISTAGSVPAVTAGAAAVPVTVSGFKKGEKWTVRVDGKLVSHGTMKKAGTLSVKVHLAKAKRDTVHTIRIAGSRKVTDPAKTASTTVTVTSLAAKKTLKVHTVSANGMKLVAVEKLAAGELVVIKDGTKVIAKGHANAYGIFAFPQSKAGKGTSKLTVHGATAKRAGKLTVKNPKH